MPKSPVDTPAARLLRKLGPVTRFHDPEEMGDLGLPARVPLEDLLEPYAVAGPNSRLGPLEKVHVFWFAGASCDGCTVSVTGAQSPSVESLMMGAHPGLPRVILHHPVVNLESGPAFLKPMELAIQGRLGAPFVVVVEGSLCDETAAVSRGGYWCGQGEEPWGRQGELRDVTASEWVARLAPLAAAIIAIGTCATWGGIPAAAGNPTGAMGVIDFLGNEYRSAAGLPVVNIPGCAPVGDNFTETAAALLYFLQGFGPLPEFDDLGRPAWLYGETVHHQCGRGAYFEEGTFAADFGGRECLVEIGCWGPVVQCNISSRGAINNAGGCMNVGGACIGCTMPGFPDQFTPFHARPPAEVTSTAPARLRLGVIDPLRRYSEARLGGLGDIHAGWADTSLERDSRTPAPRRFYKRLSQTRPAAAPAGRSK
ncbi:MAG: hydrogenase expression protein HypE [Acidimicrobiales bacterium]